MAASCASRRLPSCASQPADVGLPAVAEERWRAAGQGLVEYSLILALMAAVAVIALVFFGDAIALALQVIGDEIDRASR